MLNSIHQPNDSNFILKSGVESQALEKENEIIKLKHLTRERPNGPTRRPPTIKVKELMRKQSLSEATKIVEVEGSINSLNCKDPKFLSILNGNLKKQFVPKTSKIEKEVAQNKNLMGELTAEKNLLESFVLIPNPNENPDSSIDLLAEKTQEAVSKEGLFSLLGVIWEYSTSVLYPWSWPKE